MENKSKRNSQLKLKLMLLLLLFAVISIASTYAWFSTNKILTINSFYIEIEAESGMQISADAVNWDIALEKEDLVGAKTSGYGNAVNQIPDYMEPVSTGKTLDPATGYLNMYYGSAQQNYKNTGYELFTSKTVESAGNEGKFIAFDMFIKTEREQDVSLTPISNVTATKNVIGLENAARMAFIVEGNGGLDVAPGTIQNAKTGDANNAYIWEPNCMSHTPNAIKSTSDHYGVNLGSNEMVRPYSGVYNATSLAIPFEKTNYRDSGNIFKAVTPEVSTIKDFAANQRLFHLNSGVTKIRVYMWVEGQDYDCENYASGAGLKFDLQITSLN